MTQKITFRGKTLPVQQWALVTGIPYRTLSERYRLYRDGPKRGMTTRVTSLNDVFRAPGVPLKTKQDAPYETEELSRYQPPGVYDGLTYRDLLALQEWAKECGVRMSRVRKAMAESEDVRREIFAALPAREGGTRPVFVRKYAGLSEARSDYDAERKKYLRAYFGTDKPIRNTCTDFEYVEAIYECLHPMEGDPVEYKADCKRWASIGYKIARINATALFDNYKLREYEINAAQLIRRKKEFKKAVRRIYKENPGYRSGTTRLYVNVLIEEAAALIGVPECVYGRYIRV